VPRSRAILCRAVCQTPIVRFATKESLYASASSHGRTRNTESRRSPPRLQPADLRLRAQVVIGKTKRLEGYIRYFGGVVFAAGDWVGIELTVPRTRPPSAAARSVPPHTPI
jgi:hypothetical protein